MNDEMMTKQTGMTRTERSLPEGCRLNLTHLASLYLLRNYLLVTPSLYLHPWIQTTTKHYRAKEVSPIKPKE